MSYNVRQTNVAPKTTLWKWKSQFNDSNTFSAASWSSWLYCKSEAFTVNGFLASTRDLHWWQFYLFYKDAVKKKFWGLSLGYLFPGQKLCVAKHISTDISLSRRICVDAFEWSAWMRSPSGWGVIVLVIPINFSRRQHRSKLFVECSWLVIPNTRMAIGHFL